MKVELHPDVEAMLLQKAGAEGLSLNQFAARALEAAATVSNSAVKSTPEERVHAFEQFLDEFESGAVLPDSAFERENWYPDRG